MASSGVGEKQRITFSVLLVYYLSEGIYMMEVFLEFFLLFVYTFYISLQVIAEVSSNYS